MTKQQIFVPGNGLDAMHPFMTKQIFPENGLDAVYGVPIYDQTTNIFSWKWFGCHTPPYDSTTNIGPWKRFEVCAPHMIKQQILDHPGNVQCILSRCTDSSKL